MLGSEDCGMAGWRDGGMINRLALGRHHVHSKGCNEPYMVKFKIGQDFINVAVHVSDQSAQR